MKDLITVDGNKVIPSPYALTIPEFSKLKIEELSAVYFFVDHRSPTIVTGKHLVPINCYQVFH